MSNASAEFASLVRDSSKVAGALAAGTFGLAVLERFAERKEERSQQERDAAFQRDHAPKRLNGVSRLTTAGVTCFGVCLSDPLEFIVEQERKTVPLGDIVSIHKNRRGWNCDVTLGDGSCFRRAYLLTAIRFVTPHGEHLLEGKSCAVWGELRGTSEAERREIKETFVKLDRIKNPHNYTNPAVVARPSSLRF